MDKFLDPKKWPHRFKIKSYLKRVTFSESTLKISWKSLVWFTSCIHIYHRWVGTTEHFGNISWRQNAGVIFKHGLRWMGKIFYPWFVWPRICSMCLPYLFVNSYQLFGIICTYYIEFHWMLKPRIFPVVLSTGEQAASEYSSIKSNTK